MLPWDDYLDFEAALEKIHMKKYCLIMLMLTVISLGFWIEAFFW